MFTASALHVVERYRMTDPDTIQYEATVEDAKATNEALTISKQLRRRAGRDRLPILKITAGPRSKKMWRVH